jgi:hypothetical protein
MTTQRSKGAAAAGTQAPDASLVFVDLLSMQIQTSLRFGFFFASLDCDKTREENSQSHATWHENNLSLIE